MEPLADKNKILREALSLSEKSIQRAQRERDLVESNSRDLEHQKEVLSERLTAASEQLKKTSEQLATVSEELKNMSEQLGKKNGELKNKTEQLDLKCQQFEDVSKLKSDYRHKTKAQFDVLVQEAKVQKDNFNTITAAIKPVLDCVDVEPAPCPDGRQQGPNTIVQRCKAAKFSEICTSSKVSNPFPTVDLFLVVYEDTLKWKTISESMVTNGAEEGFFEKSTKHWVGAALATDLEVLKLLNGATGSFSRTRSTNKPNASSVEPPRTSLSKKPTHGASAKVQSKILRTQEAMSRRLSDATTEQSSNDDSSVDERPKPRKKIESTSVKAKTTAPKIILHDPKWTDGSIPSDAFPDKLSKIGKEAFERRDLAATAAANALQEALVSESVIRNISKFSEICTSSKVSNPFATVDLFLVVYEDTLKWKTISESMVTNGAEEEFFEKSTKHWVGAAIATDLEVLKLLNGATGSFSRTRSTNKPNASSVEPPRTSLSKKPTHGASAKVQSKVAPSSPLRCTWSNTETAELAKSLWREMHTWFLTFVDEALDVGFHLFEDQNVASKGKHSSHITMVLSQFKKISDWLDQVGKIAEEERTKEKIECLKRKIYGFVISHMGSAFESSVSVSSRS
ncbi:uncharacterized protein [Miscanthus floridulus]|uniref:uncharacterized protein n=1 Tax=Miscanthus floridulus TaxID=154761 RepID=UPI0034578BB5